MQVSHRWVSLENVSEFQYLGCVLDESGSNGVECSMKGMSGRRVCEGECIG